MHPILTYTNIVDFLNRFLSKKINSTNPDVYDEQVLLDFNKNSMESLSTDGRFVFMF